MRWTRVTIHPRLNNISLMPKLLRGEGIVQEPRERVMPAALRESMTAGDTQLAGGDLAGRVPGPSSPFSASNLLPELSIGKTQPESPWEAPGVVCMSLPVWAEAGYRIVESEANGGQWKRSGLPILNI